jgi:XTP/dITP diphosphohydrolase
MNYPGFELLIATRNRGKVQEIQEALAQLPVKLRYLDDFCNLSTVEETGLTYKANAVNKALEYSKQTRLCALADDSGLEVDALGGRPGVYSARYAGAEASDKQRIAKLLSELNRYPNQSRSATFVCSMAIASWKAGAADSLMAEPQVVVATEGRCGGVITSAPRGANGFGFDPIFVPDGYDDSFAELPSRVKAMISHRAHALAAIRDFLADWLGQT